jgi:HEAT repeat protein
MALPLALIATPGAGIAYAVSRASKGGVRGSLRISVRRGAYRRLAALVEERSQAPIIEAFQNIPSESRFQAPAELGERLTRVESMMQAENAAETTLQEEVVSEVELPLDDVKELESCVAEGGVGRFRSSLLQLTEVGEELFTAIQAGKIKLEKDGTPLVYSAEVARLAERVSAMPSGLITVSGGERLLRERVVEAALAKAGRRWVRAPQNLILPPDVNTTV